MDIEREIKQYVEETLLGGAGRSSGIAVDEALITGGHLDSLALMQLLGHVQQRWQVDLLALGGPQDFVSVSTLAQAIRRHAGA